MRFTRLLFATLYATAAFAQVASAEGNVRRVLVTLPPLYPLVVEVMRGTDSPELLSGTGGDAHSAILTPSQARKIATSDIIIIGDRGMNHTLTQALTKRQEAGARVIAFTELEGADPLPYGPENGYTDHVHIEEKPEETPSVFAKPKPPKREIIQGGGIDPHIWLDPIRMSQAVMGLAEELAVIDPAKAETYRYNASQLSLHLREQVDPALRAIIENAIPAQTKNVIPYITYHDSYRYFQRRYGLDKVGYVTQRPDEYIGAASMKALMEASRATRVRCIISERRGPLTQRLAGMTEAKVVPLSPEMLYSGKDVPQATWAKNDYDRLLAKIAGIFADCISGEER